MSAERLCRNCKTPLRGEYCHQCGQREGRRDRLFSAAVGEAVGDVFSWDSRFWRTLLPLLFRPGHLTAEFIAGHRARYVPPFRLYLIISFLLFLTLSISAGGGIQVSFDPQDIEDTGVDPDVLVLTGVGDAATDEESGEAGAPLEAAAGEVEAEAGKVDRKIDLGIDPNDPDTPPWLANVAGRLEANSERVAEDPAIFIERVWDYLPQIMFLMLPLFALLLLLCYAASPFHYLQHLVFALHYHSFVFLLSLLMSAIERFALEVDGLFGLALVAYLPLGLRRAYESSVIGAIGKSLLIYAAYFLLLIVGFVALSLVVVLLL